MTVSQRPPVDVRPRLRWLFAWLLGGVLLVVLNWILGELYFDRWWIRATFQPVNPSPEWERERLAYESIRYLPLVSLLYAFAGALYFRGWGCGVAVAALFIVFGSWLGQVAPGLGRM